MTNDIDSVLTQRGSNYGDFRGHAIVTCNILNSMRNSASWSKMSEEQQEALHMIAHKIGRICNGNPNYKDSWTDVIGYARLIEKDLPDLPVTSSGQTVVVPVTVVSK